MRALSQIVERTLLYFPLGLLIGNGLNSASTDESRRRVRGLIGFVLVLGLATFVEFGQLFVPGRVPDFADILIATAGGVVGLKISRLTIPLYTSPHQA